VVNKKGKPLCWPPLSTYVVWLLTSSHHAPFIKLCDGQCQLFVTPYVDFARLRIVRLCIAIVDIKRQWPYFDKTGLYP